MKLTSKQQRELDVIKYYIPSNCSFGWITDEDISTFFQWSDRGISYKQNPLVERDGFCALYWGKQRRDLQVTSYLQDWGNTANVYDFTNEPRFLVEYLAQVMKKPVILEVWLEYNKGA